MQITTAEWKENQLKNFTTETFVEVAFGVGDAGPVSDMTITASSFEGDEIQASYSQADEIKTNVFYSGMTKYATLEPGLWSLDGSAEFFPVEVDSGDLGAVGYVGKEIGNASGAYTTQPNIRIDFNKIQTTKVNGLTISWGYPYGEYATYFRIYFYNGTTLVQGISKNNTEVEMQLDLSAYNITGYDKILLYIDTWNKPYRRPRIAFLTLGLVKYYDKSDLIEFAYSQSIDLLSGALPKRDLKFTVDNTDNSYNPLNTASLGVSLTKQQRVYAQVGFSINGLPELINCGEHYLSGWDIKQNEITAIFTAQNILSILQETYHKGLLANYGISLYDLAEMVLKEAGLSSGTWYLDPMLKDIYTTSPLPVANYAECLQLIAHAGCCTLDVDRSGKITMIKTSAYFGLAIGNASLIVNLATGKLEYIYDPDLNDTIFYLSSTGELRAQQTVSKVAYYLDDRSVFASVVNRDYEINHFNSYQKSEPSLLEQYKAIEVPVISWTSLYKAELYSATIYVDGSDEKWITYNNAAVGTKATIASDNVYLIGAEYYTYACKLMLSGIGSVSITVTGTVLQSSDSKVYIPVSSVGEIQTVNNPLITDIDRAKAVGQLARDYLLLWKGLSSNFRIDPALDAGDVIINRNDFGAVDEIITDLNITYSGAFHATTTGVIVE